MDKIERIEDIDIERLYEEEYPDAVQINIIADKVNEIIDYINKKGF